MLRIRLVPKDWPNPEAPEDEYGKDSIRTRERKEQPVKTQLNAAIIDITSMDNLQDAWKQVRSNKGSAGVDGMSVYDMPECPSAYWEDIAEKIRRKEYTPLPARRVEIPKPDGTTRGLNIPSVTDRVIQAAIANYMTWMADEDMSDGSFGFRPNRCCEQAIIRALEYMNDGYDWIVDIDLRKFFDTVDHDRLMRLVDNKFHDGALTSLVRKFNTVGVMIDGKLEKPKRGIQQGGPLSPVLANLYLDQADKEWDRRGLRYVRYADDLVICVKSEKAANRVMKSATDFLEKKLKLEVNAQKSKVARPNQIKYLGFGFDSRNGKWEAIPHEKSIYRLESKINELTKRNWSVSLDYRIRKINEVIRGWCNYFRCARLSMKYLQKLGQKIRRRIRVIIWKQWKSIRKKEWGLIKLGCPKEKAHSYACARQGYVRCACTFLNRYIRNETLKRKGLLFIEEYFPECHALALRFTRTAGYGPVCPVV